ncbi:MAG: NUDIX domain-containing protein [Nocardioidaceae bacterium]|nr:NUDIX domain-containing protein [Nocardioidaceae bacterium]
MSGVERFVVVPAAYVVLLRPGAAGGREVLLMLRANTGYMDGHWASVAGHVEKGESVHAAARREALEEVGLTDLELEPWCAMQRTGATGDPIDERVDYFFTCTSWTGTPRIVEPHKCADLRWCDLDALPEPVVPHERRVLDAVRAGSTPPIVSFGFD